MRLAEKWQGSWRWMGGLDYGRTQPCRVQGEWVDVSGLVEANPWSSVPGLAGSWKLVWPLARELARHFEVFLPTLRGDHRISRYSGQGLGRLGTLVSLPKNSHR